ncbi:hypothetical protein BV25DRAFT_1541438 [Artomyces pyxidatus]|uniref:Uncharacterized protein n=1 Tax=Artomyces pyxidatus TaxID=48021 RepID=A0ACB8SKZ7_9AGAM|nr:hypothetical protein BV25DRAFT_1541438 [Artomyces pyxidatus]
MFSWALLPSAPSLARLKLITSAFPVSKFSYFPPDHLLYFMEKTDPRRTLARGLIQAEANLERAVDPKFLMSGLGSRVPGADNSEHSVRNSGNTEVPRSKTGTLENRQSYVFVEPLGMHFGALLMPLMCFPASGEEY